MAVRTQTQTPYLVIGEVSALLRTPVSTLRWWRHVGTGPRSFKVGRRVLYDEADVRAYVDACRNATQVAA